MGDIVKDILDSACTWGDIWIITGIGIPILQFIGKWPLGYGIVPNLIGKPISYLGFAYFSYAAYRRWITQDCPPPTF